MIGLAERQGALLNSIFQIYIEAAQTEARTVQTLRHDNKKCHQQEHDHKNNRYCHDLRLVKFPHRILPVYDNTIRRQNGERDAIPLQRNMIKNELIGLIFVDRNGAGGFTAQDA